MTTLLDAAGGTAGVRRLVEAWHARVLVDPVVAHAFSHGYRADHTERLAAYLVEVLGGPPAFTALGGDESAVVALHSGNGEHAEMDRRATACFDAALADVGLASGPAHDALLAWWSWTTSEVLTTYHRSADDVPAGLPLPRWDWAGPRPSSGAPVPGARPDER